MEELTTENILRIIAEKWKYISYAALSGGIVAALIASFLISPQYTSDVTLYVSNGPESSENGSINIADINASQSLVRTCLVLIKSRSVLEQVEATLGRADYDVERLKRVIKCKSVEGTEILEVAVETKEPELSMQIAQRIGEIVPIEMQRIFQAGSAVVVDSARLPKKESFPNIPIATLSGAVGAMLTLILGFVADSILDQRIKGQEDFEKHYSIPILKVLHSAIQDPPKELAVIGPWKMASGIAIEEYKVLRTNLMFCLSLKEHKRVLFSSVNSMGNKKPTKLKSKKSKKTNSQIKEATAVNSAIALAQTGAKVVLLDANLRNPSLYKILRITKKEGGLSKVLTSDNLPESLRCALEETEYPNLKVICSGLMPPNLLEIFESKKTLRMLGLLEREFDYIIIEAPDINSYSDALVLSKHQCPIVLVVGEKESDHREIKKALKSIELVNGSVIGTIITNSKSSE